MSEKAKTKVKAKTRAALEGAQVSDRLPTPLYHQIYLILHGKIVSGEYADDDRLPSEQDLQTMFAVSRITARRALDELAAGGYAVRQRGRGTRVRYKAPLPPIRASVEGLFENLLAMGLKTHVRLLEFERGPASDDLAREMLVEPGTPMLRAVRVRLLEDGPFSHLTTYVPDAIAADFTREDMASRPLLGLLERSGVVAGRADQIISATLADTHVAPLLEVEVGSPLLKIARVVYDQQGRPVEHITGLYRPDRYQYRQSLTRVGDADAKKWSPTG